MKKLIEGYVFGSIPIQALMTSLPFYQDKLHEEKVFQRFNEILTKVSCVYLVGTQAYSVGSPKQEPR